MSFYLKNIFDKGKISLVTTAVRKCSSNDDSLRFNHKVTNLEKKFLVWTGKYKTIQEVPSHVGKSVMDRARNRIRIKVANYMMAATVVGCLVMIFSGKQAAKRGESVPQRTIDMHKRLREEAAAEAKQV